MCGRFTLTTDLAAVAERFGAPPPPSELSAAPPRFNIAPTQSVIVVSDDGRRTIKQMRWGLIPSWAKDPSVGNKMINARAETLLEKVSFGEAIKKRRCLIPADGFYEWQKIGKVKQPMRIVLKSREPFGLAGLWDCWENSAGDEIFSCTIITTATNELLRDIHERMPVILTRAAESIWLNPQVQDPQQLLSLLKTYPAAEMEMYPVSPQVNSVTVDQPSNLEAINLDQQRLPIYELKFS